MIIFLIFLYSFFPSDVFTQSSSETAVSTSLTLSSCVAVKDENACNALGSHGCKWSKNVQNCFNLTSLNYCRGLSPPNADFNACDKDELCKMVIQMPSTVNWNICIDKQTARFAFEICSQLKESECVGNILCKYEKEECIPQEYIYTDGIECYGFDKDECFLNNKCIFFEQAHRRKACRDYHAPYSFICFPYNSCDLLAFECGKITDKERCNYYPEHCKWEWNACNLVNDRFCGQFSSNEYSCKSQHCKWYDDVKACLSPNTPIKSDDCRLVHPAECAKNKDCISIRSKKRCQGYAFTAQANMQKPYCLRDKPKCKCLMDDEKWGYSCVSKDWIKGSSYRGNKIGKDSTIINNDILFDEEGNCFRTISSGNYEEYNSAVEIKKPIFDCFKNFHDAALLPICGHPHFDTLAYCWRAYHYGNVDFDKFMEKNDGEKYDYMLILLDGCFFCNQKRDYFATNLKVNLEVTTSSAVMAGDKRIGTSVDKITHNYASIIDAEGNFMVALHLQSYSSKNITFSIRHRCSDQLKLNFKNMVLRLEPGINYPTRVILARKVAIGLDNASGNYSEEIAFNQLPDKADQ